MTKFASNFYNRPGSVLMIKLINGLITIVYFGIFIKKIQLHEHSTYNYILRDEALPSRNLV